jgi:hypothetical protein
MSETQGYKKRHAFTPSFAAWLAVRDEAFEQSRQKSIDHLQGLFARLLGKNPTAEILDMANEFLEVLVVMNELGDGTSDHVRRCPNFCPDSVALCGHKNLTEKSASVAGPILPPVPMEGPHVERVISILRALVNVRD